MRHFALIGRTLAHSHSKQLFDAQRFAGADYRLCELPSVEGLREWARREGLDGFNVTLPYKRLVLAQLDALSPEAAAIGAVNCVVVDRSDGRLTGYNTDAPAFADTLDASGFAPVQAYILGTGGAARAVAYALGQRGVPCRHVSRHPAQYAGAIGYGRLGGMALPAGTLLVNATPVGMSPLADAAPLDLAGCRFTWHGSMLYDLIYNPSPTLLMRQAAAMGAKVVDGSAMLRRQAELSWHLFGLQTS